LLSNYYFEGQGQSVRPELLFSDFVGYRYRFYKSWREYRKNPRLVSMTFVAMLISKGIGRAQPINPMLMM